MKKTILTLLSILTIISLSGCSKQKDISYQKEAIKENNEISISLNEVKSFEKKEKTKGNTYVEVEVGTQEEKDALNFSLQIVKSYFDNDCETFYNSLEKDLFIMEDNKTINLEEIEGIKEKLCESISKAVKGDFDYQNYLDSYDFIIMKKSEYDSEIISFEDQKDINFSNFSSNDYLFVGYRLKEGKESFMWDDLLLFMVRVKDNNWTISAISG